ncbi:ribose-phosphate diphosphokinase [Parahaliea mediterranea]|uniref:ribose-phosphate diphosphokinase n=1 Tax=Parahaliea mediterranea TaxID=651086 RepID=UPI001F4E7896|nr:ribose-phosphate diphosphokinase [Parahaliea mediterranea]
MTVPDMSQQPNALAFSLNLHPLATSLEEAIGAESGRIESRSFPDGETYLKVLSSVRGRPCLIVEELSHPNAKYLPLVFLSETLRELGAASVGLVAPYLSYMRQDRRFVDGEAVTSRLFARSLSRHFDWLVTVDPHLHRYHALDEIYSIPSQVVQGAPALSRWLKTQDQLLLVGPDEESRQWVSKIAHYSGHPYVVAAKERHGDRKVKVILQPLDDFHGRTPIIIDDVISSGQTILECMKALQFQGFHNIQCAAVHGIFADGADEALMVAGVESLITTNTIPHASNAVDITALLVKPVMQFLRSLEKTT